MLGGWVLDVCESERACINVYDTSTICRAVIASVHPQFVFFQGRKNHIHTGPPLRSTHPFLFFPSLLSLSHYIISYIYSINLIHTTMSFAPRKDSPIKKPALTYADQDRFALPTASLIASKSGGILSYGILERLCVSVSVKTRPTTGTGGRRRTGGVATAAAWTPGTPAFNVNVDKHTTARTNTSRISPSFASSPYVQSIRERERRWGYRATLERGAARCAHTSYGDSVRSSARGVGAALKWGDVSSMLPLVPPRTGGREETA